jgi:hypothetical protein
MTAPARACQDLQQLINPFRLQLSHRPKVFAFCSPILMGKSRRTDHVTTSKEGRCIDLWHVVLR